MKSMNQFFNVVLRDRTRLFILISFALATAVARGCSGEDDGGSRRRPKGPPDPLGEWSFKIYAGPLGKQVRVDIPPVPLVSRSTAKQDLKPPSRAQGLQHTQATIGTPDGGVEVEQRLDDAPGWALVYGAAAQCGMVGDSNDPKENHLISGQVPLLFPWREGSWIIFEDATRSCDERLAQTETLLCIANELANVADAIAPVTWD